MNTKNAKSNVYSNMRWAFVLFFCVIFATFIFLPAPGYCQDYNESTPEEVSLPLGVTPLPAPSRPDMQPTLITKASLKVFQELLLAPVASWLNEKKFVMRAIARLDFAWLLGREWQENSKKNWQNFDLAKDGTLISKSQTLAVSGYLFGDAEKISEEKDLSKRAYKILWNVALAEIAAKDILYQIELNWVGTQAVLRRANGIFYRQFFSMPVGGGEAENDDVFRRDVLQLSSPAAVFGFSIFGERFRSPKEDRLWLWSPILGTTRELLQSNRSDAIIGGSLTFDDLFVSAEKIQSLNATVVDEKVLFVAFPSYNYYRLEQQPVFQLPSAELQSAPVKDANPSRKGENILTAKGYYQRPDGSSTMVAWNHDTKQIPQLAPWMPTSVFFVPRRVWIIEISPMDPYYVYGKQILIVDQESMLPVYKLIYDRIGEYRKTVIGGWGLARTKDGAVRFPFVAFVLANDQATQTVTTLTTLSVQTFQGKSGKTADSYRALLSPDGHPNKNKENREQVKDKDAANNSKAEESYTASANIGDASSQGSIVREPSPTPENSENIQLDD